MFKAGFFGAYHFPWIVPLAIVNRPFNEAELKHCAGIIRQESLRISGGKINAGELVRTTIPADGTPSDPPLDALSIFGPGLKLVFPANAMMPDTQAKITSLFSPLLIGAGILQPFEAVPENLPPLPQISFRAAAVANMIWRISQPQEAGGFSSKWKIGKPVWLAAVKS